MSVDMVDHFSRYIHDICHALCDHLRGQRKVIIKLGINPLSESASVIFHQIEAVFESGLDQLPSLLSLVPGNSDSFVANSESVTPYSIGVRRDFGGYQVPGAGCLVEDQLEGLDRTIDHGHCFVVYYFGLNNLPGIS